MSQGGRLQPVLGTVVQMRCKVRYVALRLAKTAATWMGYAL